MSNPMVPDSTYEYNLLQAKHRMAFNTTRILYEQGISGIPEWDVLGFLFIMCCNLGVYAESTTINDRGGECLRFLNVPFEDEEYAVLKGKKGEERSWHDFIIELSEQQIFVKFSE